MWIDATAQLRTQFLRSGELVAEGEWRHAAQGDTLTLWIDVRKVSTARDGTLSSGTLAIDLKSDAQHPTCRIKKVECGELPDAPPTGSSR